MPKDTFVKLNQEKKRIVEEALIKEFSSHPLNQATVKSIVESTGIPRGSFYQYFESLEESYFYILEKEANGIHALFVELFKVRKGNIIDALKEYEALLTAEIFDDKKYMLYRNRYLNWNMKLEQDWRRYLSREKEMNRDLSFLKENEVLNFVKGVVHTLMERLFAEEWSRERFSEMYRKHVKWMERGIAGNEVI